VGIKALCESAEVLLSAVGAYEIGYVLGPRINAAGRLSNGLDVVRLMCTNKLSKAREISRSLTELNIKRQDITTEVLNAARVQSEAQEKIMLVVGAYHEGVIGLAAGKLVEETGRPAIVFSKGKTLTKGSARSISGFHITEALRVFEKLFINVGGHEMAAGFSINTEALPEFIKKFTKYVSDNLPEALFVKSLKIDGEISFKDITKTLFEELKQLEPFGNGNPRPLFVTEGVQVCSLKTLGKSGDHLKLQLGNKETQFESLLFRAKNWELTPKVGENLDVVYSIDENSWNGKTTLQLLIKDFHEHKPKNPKPGIRKTQRVASSKKRSRAS
jgi:single-stranded-DNA-specific exonuclease